MSLSLPDPASLHLDRRLDTWERVVAAAAAGVLDEDHYTELKQDVPPAIGKANLELAKDLAALGVDGGVLVIGVTDDKSKAGEVVGTVVAGLVDRIYQVAGKIHPPLQLDVTTAPKPDDDQRAVVVVTVPASADAPHMVDDRYWGRQKGQGAAGKCPLPNEEVRRLLDARRQSGAGFEDRLRALVGHDPDALPELGRLYLLLEPTVTPTVRITDRIAEDGLPHAVHDALHALGPGTARGSFLSSAVRQVSHVDGLAASSDPSGDDLERYVFVLVSDDSSVHLCAPLVRPPGLTGTCRIPGYRPTLC